MGTGNGAWAVVGKAEALVQRWGLMPVRRRVEKADVDEPGCIYGLVTRQRVDDLVAVMDRMETKLNALLLGVGVAVLVEVAKGWD